MWTSMPRARATIDAFPGAAPLPEKSAIDLGTS
jgi:hypothetical protein